MLHFTLIVNCIKQSGKVPRISIVKRLEQRCISIVSVLNQYCKALRTAMYKRYINSKLIFFILFKSHTQGKVGRKSLFQIQRRKLKP